MFSFEGVSKDIPKEYINYQLCSKFGWTFNELAEQPFDFIQDLITVMEIENKIRIKELNKRNG